MNAGGRGAGNAPEGGRRPPAGGEQGRPQGQPQGQPQGGEGRPGRGEQGQPQGGEGRAARGQGGAGGRAGGMGMMGMGGGSNVGMLLTNQKLEGKVIAKLNGVEGGIAKLSLRGKRAAEGSIEELGVGAGLMGGRGGRGGQGGGGEVPDGDAAADVAFEGELWIDTNSHQLVKLVLEGKAKLNTNLEIDRGGQLMGIESSSDDKFRFALQVEKAPEMAATPKADKK